jgi:hypothetical protein
VSRFKLILRVGGTIVLLVGLFFLPIGHWTRGERTHYVPSAFNGIADLGGFLSIGLFLAGVGLVALIVSFLLPGEMYDDFET